MNNANEYPQRKGFDVINYPNDDISDAPVLLSLAVTHQLR